MANGNPFLIDQGNPLQGLGQLGAAYFQKQRQDEQAVSQQQSTQGAFQLISDAEREQDPVKKRQMFIQAYQANPEMVSGYVDTLKKQQEAGQIGADKPQQQGTGVMAGYSFNPEDGTFTIDPNVKQALTDKAASKVATGAKLGAKDRQSINKDVTGLIKDTVGIHNTAKDLKKLGKMGGGPASIALVFKFMKALDPQSVVRESEFATAENSAGVPESVRNMYNKLMEGEKLGEAQIGQFIDAANVLANSAIDSSSSEIGQYLDSYEDTLPDSFKGKLMNRLPKRIGSKTKKQAPQAALDYLLANPDTANDFKAKFGYLPEAN